MTVFLPPVDLVGPPDAPHTALFCHGILGSGRNWRSFARALSARAPDWRIALVDLRSHGDAPPAPPPHTVRACAQDLLRLDLSSSVEVIVGHSFGGKVALAYAEALPPALRQAWVLDAAPGPLSSSSTSLLDHEVVRVIQALRRIPLPLASRDDLLRQMTAQGFSLGLARWMTTNLQRSSSGGLIWRFDLDGVEALIQDYFSLDLRALLHTPVAGLEIHVVRAALSDRWTPEILAEISGSLATLHTLPDAGHWLHVDNPTGLLDLLAPALRDA